MEDEEEDIIIGKLQAAKTNPPAARYQQTVDDDEGQLSDDVLISSGLQAQANVTSTESSKRLQRTAAPAVTARKTQRKDSQSRVSGTERGRGTGVRSAGNDDGSEPEGDDDSSAGDAEEDDGFVRRKGRDQGRVASRGRAAGKTRGRASAAARPRGSTSARKRPRATASPSRRPKRSRTQGYAEDDFVAPDDSDSSEEYCEDSNEDEYDSSGSDADYSKKRRRQPARKARTPPRSAKKSPSARRASAGSSGSKGKGKDRYMEGKAEWAEKLRGRQDGYDDDDDGEDSDDEESAGDMNVYHAVDRMREEAEDNQKYETGLGLGKTHERAATSVSQHDALDVYLKFLVAALVCPEDMRTFCYTMSSTPDAKVWKAVSRTIEQPISAATRTLGESVAWLDSTGDLARTRLPYVKTAVLTLPYFHWSEISGRRKKSRARSGRDEDEDEDEEDGDYGCMFDADGGLSEDGNDWSGGVGDGGKRSRKVECGGPHEPEACQACRRIGHPQQVKLTLSGPLVDSDGLARESEAWLDAIPRGEFRHREYVVQAGHQCAKRICLAMALQHWKYKILLSLSRLVSQAISDGTITSSPSASSAPNLQLEPVSTHTSRIRMEVAHLLEYSGCLQDKGEGSAKQPVLDDEEGEGGKQQEFVGGAIRDAAQYCGGLSKFDRSRPLPGYAGLKEKARREWMEDHAEEREEWEEQPDSHFLQEERSVRALTWAGLPSRRVFLRNKAAFLLFMHSDEHGSTPAALLPVGPLAKGRAGHVQPFTATQAHNAQELASTFADEILRTLREDQKPLALPALDVDLPPPTTADFNLMARLPQPPDWDSVKALFKTMAWKEFVRSQSSIRAELLSYVDVYASNASKSERDEAWLHSGVLQHGEDPVGARDRGNATMLNFFWPQPEEDEEGEEEADSEEEVEEVQDSGSRSGGSSSDAGQQYPARHSAARPLSSSGNAQGRQQARSSASSTSNALRAQVVRGGPTFDEEDSEDGGHASGARSGSGRPPLPVTSARSNASAAVKQGSGIQIDPDDE